ncbi:hypothetical protein [Mycolicibacterium mageritense]|uniref:Uncharacterized protein n=1 Tax=Mycolicibacterium mageritense TaxID=53462 RepID=A0AAI8XMA6_MYCME|nr:hypothetical protein [Mycolicibacterium mageritense]BDY27538.1 hypothetical protein hbim_01462 [Mycolicibacterium mageritense]
MTRSTPTPEEQRAQFDAWFDHPSKVAYRAAVAANGGTPLADREAAFELYRRRWIKPEAPLISAADDAQAPVIA